MKKLFTFLFIITITANVFAQAPQKMSYQAVIRTSANALVTNHAVGMRISILKGGVVLPVYVETQTPTTNANGLVSIEIGGGTVVSGDFSAINWSSGTYSIKTETDPTGGTTYAITATSQLLSVPYALNSKTAETADSLVGTQVVKMLNIQPDWTQTNLTSDDYIKNKPILDGSETKLMVGTNILITGSGTASDPYIITARDSVKAGFGVTVTGKGTPTNPYIINANDSIKAGAGTTITGSGTKLNP